MLDQDGAWVHVSAMTHRGADDADDDLPFARPPWDRIDALVASYLGPVRRAGAGTLPSGTRGGEQDVMRAAGYRGPQRVVVPRGEVVAAAPIRWWQRFSRCRDRLRTCSATGWRRSSATCASVLGTGPFAERARDVELVIWRP